jgi:type IV secretory pathway VirD2 relaxase
MVKISGGGHSARAVTAHFNYIGRDDFSIETDDGVRRQGKESVRDLVQDWELDLDAAESWKSYRGAPGRKPAKVVHNIVLSMPAGTPATSVLEASRAFARERFGLTHRYALALHTDQRHPHVHLVVKAMSEQGKRMILRKATLREWRQEFARQLRVRGIAANATVRAVRGVTKPQKSDGVYRAMRAGRSTHMRQSVESVATALRAGRAPAGAGEAQVARTRRKVIRAWVGVAEALRAGGNDALAGDVARFVRGMPEPQTERECSRASDWCKRAPRAAGTGGNPLISGKFATFVLRPKWI